MANVIKLSDVNILQALVDGTYSPIAYLDNNEHRPATPASVKAISQFNEFYGEVSYRSSDPINGYCPDDHIGTCMMGATEVFVVKSAFDNMLLTGVLFNVTNIIEACIQIIELYLGEDPENTLYLWIPLLEKDELTNFDALVKALEELDTGKNQDVVLVIEKLKK